MENNSDNIPDHLAIIMDGNGRWAKFHTMKRFIGHKKGVHVVKKVIYFCSNLKISSLTLYAFSTENWKRPKFEIISLMRMLLYFLRSENDFLIKKNIRFEVIGELERLPLNLRKKLVLIIDNTINNKGMRLNLALSYGSRSDIVNMVSKIALKVKNDNIKLKSINNKLVSSCLSTKGISNPDILIRTGGEQRLSNFLLWEIAYTELFFTNTLWPDFEIKELSQIIEDFSRRNRRYGSLISS